MLLEHWFLSAALSCFSAGTVLAWVLRKRSAHVNLVAHGLAVLGSLSVGLCALLVLYSQETITTISVAFPLGDIYLRIDPLSAWFLLALGIVGVACGVYASAYTREYYEKGYSLLAGLFNLFLLSMILVFSATHVVGFLIAWEMMAIVSFLLVNYEHEKLETRRAAFIYVVVTHVATAFLFMAFFLLSQAAGSLEFARLAGVVHDPITRDAIFLCSLIGFGAKAGMMPLHIWLPRAHPAAPSHISALMSGVMIKTAIYGMFRFFLEFLGPGPAWWGYLILFLAAVTAFLGVLYAMMENDLKKLLAYSSVENIGILLLGIGAALVFASHGQTTLASFAWIAVLYHTLNHAIFKSLLFLVAGAILQATHTRNLERLGGLVRTMPFITVIFFIGSASIAAMPPLNGFASEWLTLQTLFLLTQGIPGVFGKLAGALLTAILGLTGALAAACFVKVFGVICLGKPRSQHSQQAEEAPALMLLPAGALAVCCLVLGIWPQSVIGILQNIVAGLPGLTPTAALHLTVFQSATGSAPIGIIPVLSVMAIAFLIAYIPYRIAGKPALANGETWTCGIVPSSWMQYTATGFSKPIRRAFGAILQPQSEVVADSNDNLYFGRKLTFHSRINYLVSEALYRPLNRAILRLSGLMKQLQAGSLQLYIGYIMAATVITLLWSSRWKP